VAGGQFIQVYLNGVLLKLTDDYTAANGSDIVLTSGAATGDVLEFITFADFTVNNQNFTGGLTVDNDGSTVLTVDRATSDGTIIDVQKSGSSVGSIGVYSSDNLYLQGKSDHSGLAFGEAEIYGFRGGSENDGVTSLGSAAGRFKDLWLSAGVYLGGTGSANLLSSYEEGTFTPVFVDTFSNAISGFTYSSQNGSYTKIGNMVNVRIVVGTSATPTGSTGVSVSLPFTVTNAGNYAYGASAPLVRYITFGTSGYAVVETSKGKASAALMKVTSGTNTTLIDPDDMSSSISLNVSITYQTDS
jgi:hypothetical protein